MLMDNAQDTDDDSYEISVAGATPESGIDSSAIVRCVRAALEHHDCQSASVSIAIVDDTTIARLHEQYMNISGATDVLTFDLSDGKGEGVEGEIVLSIETAARQAQGRGHSVADEVALYAVHGVLHLLGYDDHDEADARRMHDCENEILTQLGVGAVYGDTSG